MLRLGALSLLCLAAAVPCTPLAAQVESHMLPDSMPVVLLPPHVTALPAPNDEKISLPLLQEKLAAKEVTSDPAAAHQLLGLDPKEKGNPDARTLGDMLEKPRKAVELALVGDFNGAAERGAAFLAEPKETCADYTWDYLANAVAWSYVQLGKLPDAAGAHRAAATRINDPAVRQYHLIAASVLDPPTPKTDPASKTEAAPLSLEELRNPDTYKKELRKQLIEQAKQFDRSLQLISKASSVDARLSNLKVAYENLRVVYAVDPEVGRELVKKVRPAVDSLITVTAPIVLKRARDQNLHLTRLEGEIYKEGEYHKWNNEVTRLWEAIREIKRICRIHDYLRRLDLADVANAQAVFDDAHRLLFCPERPGDAGRYVFQPIGRRSARGGVDLRRRVPYRDASEIYQGGN